MKILLIEDEPVNRGFLVDALRGDGFYVNDCSDALMALEMLRKGKPDLIVTDLALPSLSGEEFLKRPEVQGVPVLVMTAKVLPGSLPPGVGFIGKPFHLEDFLERVRHYRTAAVARQPDSGRFPSPLRAGR